MKPLPALATPARACLIAFMGSLVGAPVADAVRAEEPGAIAPDAELACASPTGPIIGLEPGDRTVPVLKGDPRKGLEPACRIGWRDLSPHNLPVQIQACFHEGLFLVHVDATESCTAGDYWIGSRWTVLARKPAARPDPGNCQALEVGMYAGTRAVDGACTQAEAPKGAEGRSDPSPPSPPDQR